MTQQNAIQIFKEKKERALRDDEREKWFFLTVDVLETLTVTERARKYWADLKSKLKNEGSELSDKIGQLKITSGDGKSFRTDVADTEQLFALFNQPPAQKQNPLNFGWQKLLLKDWIKCRILS